MIKAPEGMVAVSQDVFFSYVGPRDIVISNNSPSYGVWETRSRQTVGQTYPGWKNPRDEKAYFLTNAAFASL